MQPRTTPPSNRAARRALKRGKAVPQEQSARVPLRDGRASAPLSAPVHARTDFAARRSG
jgi:hypothetical protein